MHRVWYMLGGHKHYTGPRSNLLDERTQDMYKEKDGADNEKGDADA
jgi:hypothetical protein